MAQVSWVLLDRDGTVNSGAPEAGYIKSAEQLRLLPQAGEAIARLNRAGLPVVIVTNQRGVALGLMSSAALDAVNTRLCELLEGLDAHVEAILSCTHHKGVCSCRKPHTGLLEQASRLVGLPLESAFMVGDSETDVEAGRRAGTRTVRLAPEGTETAADILAPTLWAAADAILG